MPLRPVSGKLLMPVESEADVRALFEKALELAQTTGRLTKGRYRADIEDHFYYIGAICPQYFRPLQIEAVRLSDEQLSFLHFSFATWLYLLHDAPDSCVELLLQRLFQSKDKGMVNILESMLAAIGTPAALSTMMEYAEKTDQPDVFRELGFWLPGNGESAVPRFTRQRSAVRFQTVASSCSVEELLALPHPVGLPVSCIAERQAQDVIVWHYVTLDLSRIAGLPATSLSRVHLVSPARDSGWTLFGTLSPQHRYRQVQLQSVEEEDAELHEQLLEQAQLEQNEGRGEAILLPYDDRLVYCNGHTQMTEGVHGDVGGPPLALSLPPYCPQCRRIMFHVCTVASIIREYGDGFRSLFFCEDCLYVASQATGWN